MIKKQEDILEIDDINKDDEEVVSSAEVREGIVTFIWKAEKFEIEYEYHNSQNKWNGGEIEVKFSQPKSINNTDWDDFIHDEIVMKIRKVRR